MGTFTLNIGVEIPAYSLSKESFPQLASAVEHVTESVREEWASYAKGMPLPSGRVISNRTGEYLRSINARMTGDFSGEAFSELPYAQNIEEGSPAFDMKKILDTSLKVRLSKAGKRYLIIPFRWFTPKSQQSSAMPAAVYRWWQKPERDRTFISDTYQRLSGTGAYDIKTRERITVPGWRYSHTGAGGGVHTGFGTRLGMGDLESLGFKSDDRQAKRLVGMVNFRSPGKKGAGRHSEYLTFRVMIDGSKGWIRPAQDGFFPARTAGEHHREVAETLIKTAVEKDMQALLE